MMNGTFFFLQCVDNFCRAILGMSCIVRTKSLRRSHSDTRVIALNLLDAMHMYVYSTYVHVIVV